MIEMAEENAYDKQKIVLKGEVDEAMLEEVNSPNPSDSKVTDKVAGKLRVGDNNRATGNAQTNNQAQKGTRQGSGGRGGKRPAQAPRVAPQPSDNVQNRVKPQI